MRVATLACAAWLGLLSGSDFAFAADVGTSVSVAGPSDEANNPGVKMIAEELTKRELAALVIGEKRCRRMAPKWKDYKVWLAIIDGRYSVLCWREEDTRRVYFAGDTEDPWVQHPGAVAVEIDMATLKVTDASFSRD